MKKSKFQVKQISVTSKRNKFAKIVGSWSLMILLGVATAAGVENGTASVLNPPAIPPAGITPQFDGVKIGTYIEIKDKKINMGASSYKGEPQISLDGYNGTLDIYGKINLKDESSGQETIKLDGKTNTITSKTINSENVNISDTAGIERITHSGNFYLTKKGGTINDLKLQITNGKDFLLSNGLDNSQITLSSSGSNSKTTIENNGVNGEISISGKEKINIKSGSEVNIEGKTKILGDTKIHNNLEVTQNITTGGNVSAPSGNIYASGNITSSGNIGKIYQKTKWVNINIPSKSEYKLDQACDGSDYLVGCSGLISGTSPYDVDFTGSYPISSSTCRAIMTNKTSSDKNTNAGVYAICFGSGGSTPQVFGTIIQ